MADFRVDKHIVDSEYAYYSFSFLFVDVRRRDLLQLVEKLISLEREDYERKNLERCPLPSVSGSLIVKMLSPLQKSRKLAH